MSTDLPEIGTYERTNEQRTWEIREDLVAFISDLCRELDDDTLCAVAHHVLDVRF